MSYIQAVQCLQTKPSRINQNHSLYNDFPYVHNHAEESMHGTASFLPWHRYFLFTYEKTLQQCGYEGHLPYWDWTLDWQNITDAPVWHAKLGFGGNGNSASISTSLLGGHCVEDGPFANLQVQYIKGEHRPHCLSRGFEQVDKLREYSEWIQPSAIEKLAQEPSYETFNLDLEAMAHNAIPKSIRGDFEVFTAPNDPVFFLHHAQPDRIWLKWQQQASTRARAYSGTAIRNGTVAASIRDKLEMGGIAPDLEVAEVMSSLEYPLCYSYW